MNVNVSDDVVRRLEAAALARGSRSRNSLRKYSPTTPPTLMRRPDVNTCRSRESGRVNRASAIKSTNCSPTDLVATELC